MHIHLVHKMPRKNHMHLFYMHREGKKGAASHKLKRGSSSRCSSPTLAPLAFNSLSSLLFSSLLNHVAIPHLHTPSLSAEMACKFFFLLFLLFSTPSFLQASKSNPINPQITVMGMVYCDICSNNSFSKHSYFLPGVEVRIDCMLKAISPRTAEQISFSVNRTTNKHGVYTLEVPSVDGVQCARDKAVGCSCRASLLSTSSQSCAVPSFQSTSDQISIKSRRANMCIYSLNALSYRPSKIDLALCGK